MKKSITLLSLIICFINTANSQTGKYAQVNGLRMYYEIHGKGKPLVLIHGGGSTIETTFGRIWPELAKTHQVIGVELQAHGHSDNRDGRQITFEQDADDVAALLKQLNIDQADFFGFSNGGTTALQIAIRHPKLVSKLIIASAMYKRAGVPAQFWEGMKAAKFENMPEPYVKAFLAVNPSKEAVNILFNQCAHRMQQFTDIPDKAIEAIQSPALILIGDKDVATPEHAVEMSRRMPHASLAIIPGGHGTYIAELTTLKEAHNPPVALPIITDFLNAP